MEAKVFIIGSVRVSEAIEMRFVLEKGGAEWRPDLIVNHDDQTVCEPPPCFVASGEVLQALSDALMSNAAFSRSDLPVA